MPTDITLIHIASGETLQNLLPLLALKPQRVVQICSEDEKIRKSAANLEAAAKMAGCGAQFQIHQLKSSFPKTQEVRHAYKQLLSVFPGAVVNMTGGTKLMSLGAYLGASEFHDVSILYCDTQHKQFVQVGNEQLPESLDSFENVASQISVGVIMAAQGKQFHEETITQQLLDFGTAAWDLRGRHHEAISAWTGAIRESLPRRNGRIDDRGQRLRDFLQHPLPRALSPAAENYLDIAAQAGLLTVDADAKAYLKAEPRKSSVEHVSNLLDGGWLELAIAAMAREGNRFTDLRWSVEPDQKGEDYGETDLIAVGREKLNLCVISCKTSTQHVSTLEHLSSWRDRARTLGGSHASGHICLFRAKSEDQARNLKFIGRNMNIQVHIGEEIPAFFAHVGDA